MKKIQLAAASGTPVNEWSKHYTMPSDSVSGLPTAVFFSSSAGAPTQLDFEIYEGKLLTSTKIFIQKLRKSAKRLSRLSKIISLYYA